jgi:hypothetical protein
MADSGEQCERKLIITTGAAELLAGSLNQLMRGCNSPRYNYSKFDNVRGRMRGTWPEWPALQQALFRKNSSAMSIIDPRN